MLSRFTKIAFAFLFPAAIGMIGSIMGIASAANSLSGGSLFGGGGQTQTTGGGQQFYTPTGTGSADTSWQQLLAQLIAGQNAASNYEAGPMSTSFQQELGINQQPLVQAGQQAGQQYGNLANLDQIYASILGNQGQQAVGQGQQIWNAGADPQNALYNRTLQQVQDQARASSSAHGIGMGGVGAGVENQATSNFNIDWQNNQLARMLQALTGSLNAGQSAGQDFTGSSTLAGAAPVATLAGGQVPIAAATQAARAPAAAANQFAANYGADIQGPTAGIQQSIIPYLNYGQGAQSSAANFGLAQAGQQNQFQQQGIQQLMGAVSPGSYLNSLFSGGFGAGPPNTYSLNNDASQNFGGYGGGYYGSGGGGSFEG